jgi:hypothetical protein
MTRYGSVIEVPINVNAAANTALPGLAAPGVGFAWRILGWALISAGAVNATFQSGAGPTPRTGPLPLAANTVNDVSMCEPGSGARWFTGGDNEAVTLLLSAAVQVSGVLCAEKVPTGT